MKHIFYTLFLSVILVQAVSAQFSEDFEAGAPADWDIDAIWDHGTAAQLSSQYFQITAHTLMMAVNDDAGGPSASNNGRMVTPEINLTGIEYPFLKMEYFFYDGDYGGDEQANVHVSTDGGTSWTLLRSLPSSGWDETYLPLTDYRDQTIHLAFEYLDGDSWNYGLAIDDIEVVDYQVFSDVDFYDVATTCTHAVPGVDFQLEVAVQNRANSNLDSFDIVVDANGATQTYTKKDLVLAPFERTSFTVPLNVTMEDEDIMVNVTVQNLSTGADENATNNSFDLMVERVVPQTKSAVVVEEATGTWCTWCPRGAVFMDRATNCFKEHFVGVAVHNQDPMAFTAYDNGKTGFPGFSGFPSVIVDRTNIIDPEDIFQPIANKIVLPAAVEITVNARVNPDTRKLKVDVSGVFNQPTTSAYRWNAVLVEDGVTGTSAGYNQINAYSGGGFGLMGGYENLPGSVPAADMVYDHVGRALLAGFSGAAGSIPELSAGETSDFTFNEYTVPTTYDLENLKVAVFVHNASGRIVAAGEVDVNLSTDVFYVDNKEVDWTIAPNPIADHAIVTVTLPESGEIQLTMTDMLGRVVSQDKHIQPQGQMTYDLNRDGLPAGIYNLVLTYNGQSDVQKVVMN